ncbi:MAG: hypothetical protein AB7T86_15095 [Xanthobacteraceae bacterium]|uniref:hypothetical protein n=1 Tax=Pseudolabrys sp. TaxID=1960880 RepID=UPI003D138C28
MGHTRLGKIPTTRRWRDVVGIFASSKSSIDEASDSGEIASLAGATVKASAAALKEGVKDGGLSFIFFFLTQIALAARTPNAAAELENLGLQLSSAKTHMDLTIEVHRVIDDHFRQAKGKSDVAEMAQLAIGETLTAYFRSQPRDLFSGAQEQLLTDLRDLGTQKNFGSIARSFFSNFMSRMLGFYLSKFIKPGGRQKLVNSAEDLTRFNAELRQHAYQRAAIVHEFAEKWFSKTEFEQGIDRKNTQRFVSYACKKLQDEFLHGMDGE